MEKARTTRIPIGGLVALLAGGATLLGAFLTWIKLSTSGVAFEGGGVTGRTDGLDSIYGFIGIGAAGLVIIGSLIWIARGSAGQLPGLAVSLAGIVAATVGLFFLFTLQSRFIDFAVNEAASPELPAAKISRLLGRLLNEGRLDAKPGTGLVIFLAGSAIVVLVGIAGLIRNRSAAPASKSW